MILGQVCGNIHATIQHPFYAGKRLLMVERLAEDGQPSGSYLIAVDTVGAGAGETVLVLDEGNSARQVVEDSDAPLRAVIVAIVDETTIDPR